MQPHHWMMLLLVFVIGYLLGVAKPQFGQGLISQIGA